MSQIIYPILFEFALFWLMFAVAIIDIQQGVIPDRLNLAIFTLGVLAAAFMPSSSLVERLVASFLGGGLLWLVRAGYRGVRGYDGIGMGDVKFVGAAGVWAGCESTPVALALSCVIALAFVAIAIASGAEIGARRRIPFGPCLAAGFFIVATVQLFTGQDIIDAILAFPAFPPMSIPAP